MEITIPACIFGSTLFQKLVSEVFLCDVQEENNTLFTFSRSKEKMGDPAKTLITYK